MANISVFSQETDKPLSDSPWFWLLLFSLFGAMALLAVSGKYGKRQAIIERKSQARQRLAAGTSAANQQPLPRARGTLIPLWPLAVVLGAVAVGAGIILARTRIISLPPDESLVP